MMDTFSVFLRGSSPDTAEGLESLKNALINVLCLEEDEATELIKNIPTEVEGSLSEPSAKALADMIKTIGGVAEVKNSLEQINTNTKSEDPVHEQNTELSNIEPKSLDLELEFSNENEEVSEEAPVIEKLEEKIEETKEEEEPVTEEESSLSLSFELEEEKSSPKTDNENNCDHSISAQTSGIKVEPERNSPNENKESLISELIFELDDTTEEVNKTSNLEELLLFSEQEEEITPDLIDNTQTTKEDDFSILTDVEETIKTATPPPPPPPPKPVMPPMDVPIDLEGIKKRESRIDTNTTEPKTELKAKAEPVSVEKTKHKIPDLKLIGALLVVLLLGGYFLFVKIDKPEPSSSEVMNPAFMKELLKTQPKVREVENIKPEEPKEKRLEALMRNRIWSAKVDLKTFENSLIKADIEFSVNKIPHPEPEEYIRKQFVPRLVSLSVNYQKASGTGITNAEKVEEEQATIANENDEEIISSKSEEPDLNTNIKAQARFYVLTGDERIRITKPLILNYSPEHKTLKILSSTEEEDLPPGSSSVERNSEGEMILKMHLLVLLQDAKPPVIKPRREEPPVIESDTKKGKKKIKNKKSDK
ncbi:MAG TPA: hypothetical protein PJ989_11575 [Oligoflexia bacterium]|nr:hypothetical protein [Oligoflexia bacterium]